MSTYQAMTLCGKLKQYLGGAEALLDPIARIYSATEYDLLIVAYVNDKPVVFQYRVILTQNGKDWFREVMAQLIDYLPVLRTQLQEDI